MSPAKKAFVALCLIEVLGEKIIAVFPSGPVSSIDQAHQIFGGILKKKKIIAVCTLATAGVNAELLKKQRSASRIVWYPKL